MKKKNKIFSISLIVLLLGSMFALPIETRAKTIKEFQAEVDKYTAELEAKKAKIATNEAEIAQIKSKIAEIEKKIEATEQEIRDIQAEIDECNEEIERKSEESKKIVEYYQVSNGENAYLQYAFGATTITDMIYRLSVIEQLTDYNNQVMKELDELVKQNEARQRQLAAKKVELKAMEEELESEKERINADSASIRETMPGLEDQIKSAKANVSYYKRLGCGNTEDIQACQYRIEQQRAQASNSSSASGSVPSSNGFYRPLPYGYVTQWYSGYGGHLGIDLSSSNKSIEVYPITNGVVFAKYYDNAGALVLKIRHNVGGSYIYSTYAHLRAWYVNVGQYVTENTVIGLMGSTGYSTGPHLHLEVTTCDWNVGGGCTWATYQRSTLNPTRYVNIPSSWNNR